MASDRHCPVHYLCLLLVSGAEPGSRPALRQRDSRALRAQGQHCTSTGLHTPEHTPRYPGATGKGMFISGRMLNKNLVISSNTKMGIQREREEEDQTGVTHRTRAQGSQPHGWVTESRLPWQDSREWGGNYRIQGWREAGRGLGTLCQGGVGVFLSGGGVAMEALLGQEEDFPLPAIVSTGVWGRDAGEVQTGVREAREAVRTL